MGMSCTYKVKYPDGVEEFIVSEVSVMAEMKRLGQITDYKFFRFSTEEDKSQLKNYYHVTE